MREREHVRRFISEAPPVEPESDASERNVRVRRFISEAPPVEPGV